MPPPGGQTPQTPATAPTAAPVPFPAEAKVAYVNLQEVVNTSKSGKSGLDDMKALNDKLVAAVNAKQKDMQAIQDKNQHAAHGRVRCDTQQLGQGSRSRLPRAGLHEAGRPGPARSETAGAAGHVSDKVLPIVEAIRNEKGLWMIFQIGVDNSPIVAAHAGLDLTAEVIKRLDPRSVPIRRRPMQILPAPSST